MHFAASDLIPSGAYVTADIAWIYLASAILAAVIAHTAITAAAGVRGATIGAAIAVAAAGTALIPAAGPTTSSGAKIAAARIGPAIDSDSSAALQTAAALDAACDFIAGSGSHAALFVATSRLAAASARNSAAASIVRAATEALYRLRAAREVPTPLGPRLALLALLVGNAAVATCATYATTVFEFLSVGCVMCILLEL